MPDAPPYIAVKDWKKHQHYRDDRPAWIKLYGALLDDAAFLGLSDAAQLQLIKIWLLASRMGHPLPNNPKLLAGKIGCRSKFDLATLVQSGFLLYAESRESLDDSSGTKRETETETERDTTAKRRKPDPEADQVFEEAWAAYPKRPNNSKQKAYRAWLARVGEGVDVLDMLEGTRRYARYLESDPPEHPKFIKQASTFYGPDKWYESDYTPAITRGSLEDRALRLLAEDEEAEQRSRAALAAKGVA